MIKTKSSSFSPPPYCRHKQGLGCNAVLGSCTRHMPTTACTAVSPTPHPLVSLLLLLLLLLPAPPLPYEEDMYPFRPLRRLLFLLFRGLSSPAFRPLRPPLCQKAKMDGASLLLLYFLRSERERAVGCGWLTSWRATDGRH